MTRNYLPIILLAAVMTVAGCNKAGNEIPEEEGTYEFVLNASASMNDTRVTYEDDMIFSWSKDDEISVLFHKGSDNKFFTLKASSAGASSIFKGSVTNGYVLGSDTDEKIAFFPAGSHTYSAGTVVYNIPSEIDFTNSHYTAHVPMAAVADEEDHFVFKPMASIVKFTFTNVKASKVRFTVQNQVASDGAQVKLSGDFELKRSENSPYFYYGLKWHEIGTAEGRLSYIANVSGNKVSFYLPIPAWNGGYFIPEVTLADASNDGVLYSATAKNGLPDGSTDSLGSIIVLPEMQAHSAEAWKFPSKFDIDWNSVSVAANGDTASGFDAVHLLKLTADSDNLYAYFEVKKSALWNTDPYVFENKCHFYFWNNEEHIEFDSWLKYEHSPWFLNWAGKTADDSVAEHGDYYCYEVAFIRSMFTTMSMGTLGVIFDVNNDWCYGSPEIWGHNEDPDTYGKVIGRAPAGDGMLEIDLP